MPQINFGQPVNNTNNFNHIMNIKNEDYQYQSNMSIQIQQKSRMRDKIMVSLPLQLPMAQESNLVINKA
jgi:hypothetical protein